MRQNVRLRRGLYVHMHSYSRDPLKRLRLSFPFFFCFFSFAIGALVFNHVEEQLLNCQPTAYHDHTNHNSTRFN